MIAARFACYLLAGCTSLCACDSGYSAAVSGGDPVRGRLIVREVGCGACHTVPGIRQARGVIGPPLTAFARRSLIAGNLPNTPSNLTSWIVDPQAIEPATAMPALGLTAAQARDVAAFLYTLD